MSYSWQTQARLKLRKIWATIRKDKYDKIAAELTDLLLQNWDAATRGAIENVIRAIKGSQPFDDAELEAMLSALRLRLSAGFQNDMAKPMLEIHTQAYGEGMKDVLKVQSTFQFIDNKALDVLQRHQLYWIGNFWDAQLGERVAGLGKEIIEQGLPREQAGQMFDKAFADQFGNYAQRYWEGFANHVVTRTRELGAVEGYVRAEIEEIEIVAVMDRRTTPICREMHGRIFKVSEAVELRNQLLDADNPEDAKKIAPWLKPEQVQNKRTSKLPTGVSLPPYHFNCRTRTIKHTTVTGKNQVKDVEIGANVGTSERKALTALTPAEWSNQLQTIRSRRKMRYDDDLLDAHFTERGKGLGFGSTDEYIAGARKVITDSRAVFVGVKDGEKSFRFIADGKQTTVSAALQIVDFRAISSIPQQSTARLVLTD